MTNGATPVSCWSGWGPRVATKSDQIRKLLAEGKSRSEVAKIVGCSYQQVYQVDKKRGASPTRTVSVGVARPFSSQGRRGSYRGYGGPRVSFGATDVHTGKRSSQERHALRTGPLQIRIAVQDGHEVLHVEGGCGSCKRRVQYSIRHLAYVHTDSTEPVTRLIDLQTGPGLFDQ